MDSRPSSSVLHTILICVSDKQRSVTGSKQRRIEAVCQDIIFASASGIKKLRKISSLEWQ